VQANLLRFLELSLTLEGGRYPSLPKFIDALNLMRRASDEEAPDEGQAADAENAVHIHTVHGAKGLERPIVWLLNANATPPPRDAYSTVVDWQPGAEAPCHFSFTSTQEQRGQARNSHFEREARLLAREELNLLYVAMTRAQQYLIVSGSASSKAQDSSWYARLAAVLPAGDDLIPPDLAALDVGAPEVAAPAAAPLADLPAAIACGQRRQVYETPAMRHGTLLHRLLEQLTPPAPAKDKIVLQQEWGIAPQTFDTLWREAQAILNAPHLARFFDPARYRRAWNELPYLSAGGDFLRIDRLVEFEQEIWVLDYKSTESASTATLAQAAQPHRAQLQNYMAAMQSLFSGKQTKGGLIFQGGLFFEIGKPEKDPPITFQEPS
jgi:ATP-dependent helicase/nuclease subunit A